MGDNSDSLEESMKRRNNPGAVALCCGLILVYIMTLFPNGTMSITHANPKYNTPNQALGAPKTPKALPSENPMLTINGAGGISETGADGIQMTFLKALVFSVLLSVSQYILNKIFTEKNE